MLKLRIEDCKSLLILGISEPHTEILGGPSIFIEEGATMNLTCVVRDSPEPPQFIFWYRDEQVQVYTVHLLVQGVRDEQVVAYKLTLRESQRNNG